MPLPPNEPADQSLRVWERVLRQMSKSLRESNERLEEDIKKIRANAESSIFAEPKSSGFLDKEKRKITNSNKDKER